MNTTCSQFNFQVYRRFKSRPDNPDSPSRKVEKERALSGAFMHYLASTGPFGYYKEEEGSYTGILVSKYCACECRQRVYLKK